MKKRKNSKSIREGMLTTLASEDILAKEWGTLKEDEAWGDL